jgi:hypothetical protein
MLVRGFGATIRRSGYRFIVDGADRHKRWGPGTARFPGPLSHRYRNKPAWCVVRVLRAQDAQQAVLLVVDAGGEPERVGAPVVAVPGSRPHGPGSANGLPVEVSRTWLVTWCA